MTSKPRNATLSVGMLAAVLLAAGCQSHVGTAATIGGERITTKTLDTAYKAATLTTSGKAAGSKLQAQVLTQLVQNKQIVALAKSQHVVVPQGDVDKAYNQLITAAVANKSDQPDSYWRLNAQTQATAVAIMKADNVRTKKVDAFDLYAVPVKDEGVGETVLGLLAKSPGDGAAIAKKYSTDPGLAAAGGEAGIVPAAQLGVPTLTTQPVGVATIATVGTTIAVLLVHARLDEADFSAALSAGAPVKVNPRFGTWAGTVNPQTGSQTFSVVPATSDVVAPDTAVPSAAASSNPLTDGRNGTDTQVPAATAPASAAPSVPPSDAPSATPAPSATSATASSAPPSASPPSASAPSATPAPSATS